MDRLPKVQFELAMCGEGCSASMHKTQLESANYLLPRCSKLLSKRCMFRLRPVQNNDPRSSWLLWCTRALYKYPTAVLLKALPLHPMHLLFTLFKRLYHKSVASIRARALCLYLIAVLQKALYTDSPKHDSRQAMLFGALGFLIYIQYPTFK